jgi:hypothetical protein
VVVRANRDEQGVMQSGISAVPAQATYPSGRSFFPQEPMAMTATAFCRLRFRFEAGPDGLTNQFAVCGSALI